LNTAQDAAKQWLELKVKATSLQGIHLIRERYSAEVASLFLLVIEIN
jgi:hypothetical protein